MYNATALGHSWMGKPPRPRLMAGAQPGWLGWMQSSDHEPEGRPCKGADSEPGRREASGQHLSTRCL